MALYNSIRVGIPLISSYFYLAQQSPIMNETKRRFYEDEEHVTPLPGTVITATDAEIEALGPNKLINGSSIRSPSIIESNLGSVRKSFNSVINTVENTVDSVTAKYHKKEEHFTSAISNLHNKNEDLLPAGLYILVAGLSGTILTRRSNILLKTVVPLTLAVIGFKLTLPRTFSNTSKLAREIEHDQAPELAKKQDALVKDVGHFINKTEAKTKEASNSIDSTLDSLKTSFKKFTGLNIDDNVTKK